MKKIAEWLVSHDKSSISQKDLAQLNFWAEFGLNAASFVRHLVKEHILHDSNFEGVETLYFAFGQHRLDIEPVVHHPLILPSVPDRIHIPVPKTGHRWVRLPFLDQGNG